MKDTKKCTEFDTYISGRAIFAEDKETGREAFFEKAAADIRAFAHTLLCGTCAEKKRRMLLADRVIRSGFLPPPPAGCEEAVMVAVLAEDALVAKESDYFSMRGWAVAGVVIVASLLSVYFNIDFGHVASSGAGASYIIPLGITIGAVVTIYGALFIGSHLQSLCDKLGLEL